jgi:NADH-quinone oxidoreductase subunit K
MIPITYYVMLSAVLFSIGGVGFLWNRNVLIALMSIEVMLNAVNLALVAFNRIHTIDAVTQGPAHTGQLFAFFLIAAEAAEVAVGLAIVLSLFRLKRTVRSDEADLLRN